MSSLATWTTFAYFSKTEVIPASGGEYIEGIVGQPIHINPILSQSNETDADIAQMIFSGLMSYDGEGTLIPELAEDFEITEDKTRYIFHLRKNVTWHDGERFTAHDVLFTANIISDPLYKSPLRANWQGIETELIDDYTIAFTIKSPYAGFMHNLTFGILPKHIWEGVEPENFQLTDLNLQPIGTGPYKYYPVYQKDSKGNILVYKLVANPSYFLGKPYISKITLNFYAEEDEALSAYNRKEIMGIYSLSSHKMEEIKNKKSLAIHRFHIPRYFSVFLNQTKSIPVATDEVRDALAYATDKNEIIEKVLRKNGEPVYSPVLPGMIGYREDMEHKQFDLEKANNILEENKWERNSDGWRAKDGIPLTINLITTDWNELTETASVLKTQWEKAGIKTDVLTYSISDIQQNHIRPREYEALLFGQVTGADPDPYSFWHSSQKKDPGLNLALFGDNNTDKLIEEGRMEFDKEKRSSLYQEFQEKLEKETPAIFLYSPYYIYPMNKSIKGVEQKILISPSRRFGNINKWYIKTSRIWK